MFKVLNRGLILYMVFTVLFLLINFHCTAQHNTQLYQESLATNLKASELNIMLQKYPDRANSKTCSGQSALNIVIRSRREDSEIKSLVQTLLAHGAEPNSRIEGNFMCYENENYDSMSGYGYTPLQDATSRGLSETAGLLLKHGASLDKSWDASPIDLIQCKHTQSVFQALIKNATPSQQKDLQAMLLKKTEDCTAEALMTTLLTLKSILFPDISERTTLLKKLIEEIEVLVTPREY